MIVAGCREQQVNFKFSITTIAITISSILIGVMSISMSIAITTTNHHRRHHHPATTLIIITITITSIMINFFFVCRQRNSSTRRAEHLFVDALLYKCTIVGQNLLRPESLTRAPRAPADPIPSGPERSGKISWRPGNSESPESGSCGRCGPSKAAVVQLLRLGFRWW